MVPWTLADHLIDPPQMGSVVGSNYHRLNLVPGTQPAQAAADQKLVQSRTAVEIETLRAHAEVEPLKTMSEQLHELKRSGPDALPAYIRNVRLRLFTEARRAILEVSND